MTRKVGTVEIQGINSANVIPAKGSCSDIKNLRLKGNVWENVSDFSIEETIDIPSEYKILFVHDSDDIEKYIAEKDGYIYYIKLGEQIEEVFKFCQNVNYNTPRVSCFGNYLSIKYTEESPIVERQFVWYNDAYVEFNIDQLTPINDVYFTTEYKTNEDDEDGMCRVAEITVSDLSTYEVDSKQYYYSTQTLVYEDLDYITGVVYLFFAYKLYDGSVVKSSKIYMLQFHSDGSNTLRVKKDDTTFTVYIDLQGYKASCEIELSDDLFDTDIVDSVVIYSSRDNPIYDLDNFTLASFMSSSIYNNTYYQGDVICCLSDSARDALQSPFYLLKEYELSECEDGVLSVELTKDDFDDIEFNDVYVPNYSNHQTTVSGDYEYNNRLHKYGICTVFSEEIDPFYRGEIDDITREYELTYDEEKELVCVVRIEGDTENLYIQHRMPYCDYATIRNLNAVAFTPVVSYPDSRAKELTAYYYDITTETYRKFKKFTLTPSYGLNYSYYIDYDSKYSFGENTLMYTYESTASELPVIENLLVEKSKIMVSNFGNPYVYEAEHNYFIGEIYSTEIYALAAVLSDNVNETTGIYPLTVFTSDGIYSLEQGTSSVLYSRIVKVSSDIILQNSNIISVNKMLFFISNKGLLYLSGSKVSVASDNFSDEDKEYFDNSTLMLIVYYDEIMAYNEAYDYAYVYSITSGFWTKRDISGFVLSSKTFYNGESIVNFTIKEDDSCPLKPYLLTREIDYGNIGLVRFDTVVAELRSTALIAYSFVIYGSLDLENWVIVGYGYDCAKIRRTASSWRYYKFEVDVNLMENLHVGEDGSTLKVAKFYISSIAVEFYNRFTKHLNDNNDGNMFLA